LIVYTETLLEYQPTLGRDLLKCSSEQVCRPMVPYSVDDEFSATLLSEFSKRVCADACVGGGGVNEKDSILSQSALMSHATLLTLSSVAADFFDSAIAEQEQPFSCASEYPGSSMIQQDVQYNEGILKRLGSGCDFGESTGKRHFKPL
jgi:hypothetical protein